MPTISVNNEKLKGFTPVPGNIYEFEFKGFKPAMSKNKDSVNYNPILEIVNHPEYEGRKIFENLNSKADWIINDFVHSLGFEMVKKDENTSDIPGDFDGNPDDMTTWTYRGPMMGARGKCELVATTYQGKPQNKVKQWICQVKDCAIKNPDITHSTNLIK